MLNDGLNYRTKTTIESLYNGAFTIKTTNDAWVFFKEVAENTLEWKPVSIDVKHHNYHQ